METDDEVSGEGNSLDFGARIYDPRLGRWMSIDPEYKIFPSFSSYNSFGDNPILYVDEDGRVFSIGGNREKAIQDVKSIIPSRYISKLKIDNNGSVQLKISQRKVNKINDIGLTTLKAMIEDRNNHYMYEAATGIVRFKERHINNPPFKDTEGEEYQEREVNLNESGAGVLNISNKSIHTMGFKRRYINGKISYVHVFSDNKTIDQSYDSHIAIGDKVEFEDIDGNSVPRASVVLHEFIEAIYRTEKKQQYEDAHQNAIDAVKEVPKDDPRYTDDPGGERRQLRNKNAK